MGLEKDSPLPCWGRVGVGVINRGFSPHQTFPYFNHTLLLVSGVIFRPPGDSQTRPDHPGNRATSLAGPAAQAGIRPPCRFSTGTG
jgi:hypothetical protein